MYFFSIILPTYNRAHLINKAINSVLSQTYTNWELIVVDDGSTDNTKEVVSNYKDERIKYIYQENAERSAARNNGINHAQGDWICFLDSDDEYLDDHLEQLEKEIKKQKFSVGLYLTGHFIASNGLLKKHPLLNTKNNILKEIWQKFILMNAVCVHQSILQKEKFNSRFRIWEDTHLWMRIAAFYPIYQLQNYTCRQNISEDSTVKNGFEFVTLTSINQYIDAVSDLQKNYSSMFVGKLSDEDFSVYIDNKYRMYLYQARQNKQLVVSLKIWFKAFFHQPSFYLMKELPKIFINQLNIGIHEK